MTHSNRRIWLVAAALSMLCLLAAWHWQDRLFAPEQGLRVRNEPGPEASRPAQPPPDSRPPLRPTGTPIEVKDAKTISMPIIWIGEPAKGPIDVLLVKLDGSRAGVIGRLNASFVELPLPPEGEYRLDFASAGLFSVEHQINVVQGLVQVLAGFTFIDQKLPVARGTRVRLIASFEGAKGTELIPLRWYPLGWPRQQSDGSVLQRPELRVTLAMNQAMDQLVPAAGIEFHLDTKEFTIKKPRPTEFARPKGGDLLSIELEGLIPLIVDLDEGSPGAWVDTLKRCSFEANHDRPGSRLVVVEAHAIDLAGGRVPEIRGDGMFERLPKDLKSTGGVVDSFTIMVPRPQQDATVHAMLRVYGLTYVAAGQVAAGPYMSEIRLTARLLPLCTLSVTVVDSQGAKLEDIPVQASVFYRMKSSGHSLSYRTGTTSSDGKVEFTQLPAGEQVFADVTVSSGFRKSGDDTRVQLTPGKTHEVVIRLETGDDRILRVAVKGSGSSPGARLVVLEGDGNSAWFRAETREIPAGARQAMLRVRASFVMVLGKSGQCVFSGTLRLDNSDSAISFNLDDAAEVNGQVRDCAGATLYPYNLSPSVIFADSAGSRILPAAAIDANGKFTFAIIPDSSNATWHVAGTTGEVLAGAALRTGGAESGRELQLERVATSSVQTTIDAEKAPDAKHFELLFCPVFMDQGRTLDAQLMFALRVEAKNGKVPDVALPHGRYVVLLTYADSKGAMRLGAGAGMYAEFESRKDLATKVHLPIK